MCLRFGCILMICFTVQHMNMWCKSLKQNEGILTGNNSSKTEKIRPKISDKYCRDKFSCKFNHTCLCHSDPFCEVLNDCCQGYKTDGNSKNFPDISRYSCKKIRGENVFGAFVVSACPKNWTNNESRLRCEKGRRLTMSETFMTDDGIVYNNMFCAFCNNVLPAKYSINILKACDDALRRGKMKDNENCTSLFDKTAQSDSLRSCLLQVFKECPKETPTIVSENCTNGEYGLVYDKYGNAYRNVYCGLCHNKSLQDLSCEKNKVDTGRPYAYTILVDRIENRGKIENNIEQNSTQMTLSTNENDVLMYITVVALTISIVALLVMLFVYCRFPKLMNVGGKITFCLALSLLIAQSLFLISSETEPIRLLCRVMAVLVHYFYLVTFCWMNIISFDLFLTFSHLHLNWEDNRFLYYSLYAWLSPLVIMILSLIFNFIDSVGTFSPRYGENVCWFNSEDGKLIFFMIPLAIFKFFDIVAFVFTIHHIRKSRKEAAFARKQDTYSFFIYIKLSFIMGLTWTFAFLARYSDNAILMYMFTIFNGCQGLSLFLCFVLTNTVLKLVKESFSIRRLSAPFSSSNTTRSTRC